MDHLLEQLNAPILYALVGVAILLVVAMCVTFMVKSWRAGLRLGMDRAVLKKTVISSATFTLLPAFSILLGVIALSGSLGIPLPWLRLSVIGNLQYEVNVAEIAATGIGLSGHCKTRTVCSKCDRRRFGGRWRKQRICTACTRICGT